MERGWYLLGTFLNILFSFLQFKTIWQIQVAFPCYYYFFLIKEEVSQVCLESSFIEDVSEAAWWHWKSCCLNIVFSEIMSQYLLWVSCFFEKNQNQKLSCIHSFLCYCSQTLFCTRMITNFKTSQTTPPLFS